MADKPLRAESNGAQNNQNDDRLDGDVSPEDHVDGLKPKKTPAQIERERMRRRRRRQRRKIMGSITDLEGQKPLDGVKDTKGEPPKRELPREKQVEHVSSRVRDEAHPRPLKPDKIREKSKKSEESHAKKPEQPAVQKPEEPSTVSAHSFDLGDEDLVLSEKEKAPASLESEVPEKEVAPPLEEIEILEEETLSPSEIEEPIALKSELPETPVVEEVESVELAEPSPVEPVEEVEPAESLEPSELEPLPRKESEVLSEPEEDLIFGEPEQKTFVPVGRLHEEGEILREQGVLHNISWQPTGEDEKPLSHEETPEDEGEHKEHRQPPAEEKAEKDVLAEKQTTAFKIAAFFADAGKNVAPHLLNGLGVVAGFLKKLFLSFKFRYLIPVIVILALGGGGYSVYTQQYHVKVYHYMIGFFQPQPVEKVDVEVKVKVDENDLRRFGIETALLFARNEGSVHDILPIQIFNSDFFGGLKEPKVRGETGISAATYYGELKDQEQFVNLFQEYVRNLQGVQSLYKTDVYAMLDQSVRRDEALLKYLDQLQKSREESTKVLDQIHINLDDLKVSYDSLNPDKSRLEADFFASLQALEPEKSDQLLKSFIDVIQKQAALKARNSALAKLADYYTAALQRLDTRIKAVDKNRDALIQGIRVVDIPGSDLNMIIRGTN